MNKWAGLLLCIAAIKMTTVAHAQTPTPWPVAPPPIFVHGERVLFQGDSITDMNRGRTLDPNHILGHSYAFIIGAEYGAAYPESQLVFFNRGVSGNRITDLAARWKADTLDLNPTVLSVLIGVNDLFLASERNQPVSVQQYEDAYNKLLSAAVASNPKIKLILCEPFILPGTHTTPKWAQLHAVMQQMQAAVARLGTKYHVPVVPLQKVFDDAATRSVPADYWIWDGVHPTYSGQQLLSEAWVTTFEKFYGPAAIGHP